MTRSNFAFAPQIAIDFGITVSNDNVIQGFKHLKATGQLPKKASKGASKVLVKKVEETSKVLDGTSNVLKDASKQNTSALSELDETQADASNDSTSTDEPSKDVLTHSRVYAYIRPYLAKGVPYTALATRLGKEHGHASVLVLEQVAASVELGRSQKQNALTLYQLIEKGDGCQFAACTLLYSAYHCPLMVLSPPLGKA
jgi:hypothetical protein